MVLLVTWAELSEFLYLTSTDLFGLLRKLKLGKLSLKVVDLTLCLIICSETELCLPLLDPLLDALLLGQVGSFDMDFFRNQICNEFHSSLNIILIKDGLELRFQGTGEELADVES